MPRPPRADEANGLYHALNRGNGRARIFLVEMEPDQAKLLEAICEGPTLDFRR